MDRVVPSADSVADDQQGILLGGVIPRPCVQTMALHQASPVRRLMLSKLLPFACTAGGLARWEHLPRGRRSSPHFAGIFQTAS
jgi:hypothetical protein